MAASSFYTDLHMKVPFLELGYTTSAIDISISHRPVDSQASKSVYLTANRHDYSKAAFAPWNKRISFAEAMY
jgi:hypothetical protein